MCHKRNANFLLIRVDGTPFVNPIEQNTVPDSYHVIVSSGGLAVKHPVLCAKGHRFEPSKRSKLFRD